MRTQMKFRDEQTNGSGRLRWLIVALLIAATVLGFCGRSASAQTARVQEIITRALEAKPDAANGETLYRHSCSDCHGASAQGDARSVIPALAGQVSSYLIKQLADMAEGDRESADMHRVAARADLTTPQALSDLGSYLSQLAPPVSPETGDGERIELGGRIYTSICAQCHGQDGAGAYLGMVPAVRGQHYSYLLSQARRLALGHRYSVDIDVLEVLEAMSLDELTATADYMSRLPGIARQKALVQLEPARPD